MKEEIAIIGAGGHTRSLLNLINQNDFNILGIFDDNYSPFSNEFINGHKLCGNLENVPSDVKVVLSIGNNQNRFKNFIKFGEKVIERNLVHVNVIIQGGVNIGASNQIFSGVYINSNTKIGFNNILNTHCILEHEVTIGNHNHISVGAICCGRSKIGDRCFIGASAVLVDNISICDDVVIGANSVVIHNIFEPGTYVGNPVRKIK